MVQGSTGGQCQSHDFRPHNNFVNDDGTRQLAEALVNASLTTFNLGSNSMGAHGARQLAEALKVNASLMTLNLTSNSVGDDGAASWLRH